MSTAMLGPPRTASPVPKESLPLPEEPLYEIVDGLVVELPPISFLASVVASRLQNRMGPFVETHRLGIVVTEALFILDAASNLRRRPDLAFVSVTRWPLDRLVPTAGDGAVVPDLAVEVVSPTDFWEDVLSKMREYFAHGVRQVWLVSPVLQEVHVCESPTRNRILTREDTLDGGTLLPGFQLPLAELFPPRDSSNTSPPA
jgi:Uma2 family endonuclease